jgi:hypothetical protein
LWPPCAEFCLLPCSKTLSDRSGHRGQPGKGDAMQLKSMAAKASGSSRHGPRAYQSSMEIPLTRHALIRMNARRFSPEAVDSVIAFGRIARTRGAEIHVLGRRQVREFASQGVDLRSLEGVHVVCSLDGTVLTVYRNHDLRDLKPRRRSPMYRRRAPSCRICP